MRNIAYSFANALPAIRAGASRDLRNNAASGALRYPLYRRMKWQQAEHWDQVQNVSYPIAVIKHSKEC
jgi:hypothetical protein